MLFLTIMKNKTINAIIIENCSKSLEYLNDLLNNYSKIDIIGTAHSIKDGYKLINRTKPDIIFLDIELDDGNAFKLLNKIVKKNFEIVFTTAYNNYYQQAFKHFAFNYLLKPISPSELDSVIKHYMETFPIFNSNRFDNFKKFIRADDSKILLNTGYNHILISISDIIYCKADQNFTIFRLTSGDSKIISNSLKYYSELFFEKGFFKANRSFLVNIAHIKQIIKRESLIMTNNEAINISVKNRQNLKLLIDKIS